jgi:hypothetical protein
MVRDEPQIISVLSASGEVQNAKGFIYLNEYQSIGELITDVDDYIEFYNHRRFHETLKYKKPMNVYRESIKLNKEKVKDT